MSQDIVADALNKIMNATRAGKTSLKLKHHSKLLISILAIAKLRGYLKNYHVEGTSLEVEIGKLNACQAIKPRYMVSVEEFDRFVKRYLPAKNIGVIIISTSQGIMTHHTAYEKNVGGSLLAYLY